MPAIREPERNSELLDTLFELVDPRPAVSDAYWAATHPIDRVMGRGRASNGQMMFPWGAKFPPKSYVVGPPEKGLTAVRLPQSKNVPLDETTKDSLTWRGSLMRTGYYQERERGMPREFWDRENFRKAVESGRDKTPATAREIRKEARYEHGSPVRYNVIDKNGKIVGSSHFYFKPDEVVVGETFLKKEFGGSPTVFKDMMGPAVDHAMKNEIPINATAGNPKVARLLRNMAKKVPSKDRPMISSAYGTAQARAQPSRIVEPPIETRNPYATKSLAEVAESRQVGAQFQRRARERAAEQIRDRPLPRQIEENPNPLGRKDFATAVDARAAGMAFQRQQRELQARREAALEQIQQTAHQTPAAQRAAARLAAPRRLSPTERAAEEQRALVMHRTEQELLGRERAQHNTRARNIAAQREHAAMLERARLQREQMLAAQRRAYNPIRISRPGRGGV